MRPRHLPGPSWWRPKAPRVEGVGAAVAIVLCGFAVILALVLWALG